MQNPGSTEVKVQPENCRLEAMLEQTASMHAHLCPRQVLGVRMGIYAATLLELDLPDHEKRLYTFVETDGCFADGIAVASGCWFGHRTLRLVDFGKVAATFVDTATERAIRIIPHPLARERASLVAPRAAGHWQAQLEAYQCMPDADLLQAQEVQITLPLEQIISKPGLRTVCAECGEEMINAREVESEGRILCRHCAGTGYYRRR